MYVLVTSPRVAPGLMTLLAWDVLRGADDVLCPADDDPTAQAVRDAGIDVRTGPRPTNAEPGTVWLAPVGDVAWAQDLAARLVDGVQDAAAVEVVFGSYDLPGARLLDLVEVMDRLRRECPWTREQTHESLSGYLLEESYEVLEALDRGDHDHLREELGDVLMQVVFHAAVAQGRGDDGWSIDDVAEQIVTKLVHRNPHVFGDAQVTSAAEV
ncbi:MAG: MazG family protein, partial [Nocardioidaceae bacterium]